VKFSPFDDDIQNFTFYGFFVVIGFHRNLLEAGAFQMDTSKRDSQLVGQQFAAIVNAPSYCGEYVVGFQNSGNAVGLAVHGSLLSSELKSVHVYSIPCFS
jgi:hypothetical protein